MQAIGLPIRSEPCEGKAAGPRTASGRIKPETVSNMPNPDMKWTLKNMKDTVFITEEWKAAMGIRAIHLDDRAEGTFAELRKRTGLPVSEVFQRGLQAYAASASDEMAETPYEVFHRLDLGPGGYAAARATRAKTAVAAVIDKKHGGDPGRYWSAGCAV